MDSSDGRPVNSAARHAVFIEPEGELREMVLAWKARLATRWPAAAYLDHPPHSTVWAGDVVDAGDLERALVQAASRVTEFRLTIRPPYVFYDDALAGGGQTCAFAAVLTDEVTRVQQVLSNVLREHRMPAPDHHLPPPLLQEPFLRSWREFGFPFVGTHWIPHFTVASIPVRRDDPVIEEFLATTASWEMPVKQLSWWRIVGERHERLASLPLAPPVC